MLYISSECVPLTPLLNTHRQVLCFILICSVWLRFKCPVRMCENDLFPSTCVMNDFASLLYFVIMPV